MAAQAKNKFAKKSIKDRAGSSGQKRDHKIGEYKDGVGGGEVIQPDGLGKFDSTAKGSKGRGTWDRTGNQESRASNQPRTDDGKFTYNSVNGLPLKDISKDSNGQSRGTTIPPTLTKGENGIHFKGTKFDQKKWEEWGEENQWWAKGAVVAFKGKIKIAPKRIEEIAQEIKGDIIYDENGKYKSGGYFEGEDVSKWKSKSGAHSGDEKKALKGSQYAGGKFVKKSNKKDIAGGHSVGDKYAGDKTTMAEGQADFNTYQQNAQSKLQNKMQKAQTQAQAPVQTKSQTNDYVPAQSVAPMITKNTLDTFRKHIAGLDEAGLAEEDISEKDRQALLSYTDDQLSDVLSDSGLTEESILQYFGL